MSETNPFPFTLTHAGSCPNCSYVFPPIWAAAATYYESGNVVCQKCGSAADLWTVVNRSVAALSPAAWALTSLGASHTTFIEPIRAGEYRELQLTNFGVPSDAILLQTGYTPQGGGVFPIEWHGNVPERRMVGTTLRLFGRPMEGAGSESPVAISVMWVPRRNGSAWPYIINSFEAFVSKRYDELIVPAQSAVEIGLMPILRELLENYATAQDVVRFMADGLTFSHALNVFLPFASGQKGIARMPQAILEALNRLRRMRNRLVHTGRGRQDVTVKDACDVMCAAVFGFEYANFLRSRLL